MRDMLMDGVEPDSPTIAVTVLVREQFSLVLNTGSKPFANWNATLTAMGTEAQESWMR